MFVTEDCFACLEDHLCIQNEKFCDMNVDCPDESDERNCGMWMCTKHCPKTEF